MISSDAPGTYIAQMGMSFKTSKGVTVGRLPLLPALCTAPGWMRIGALGTLADCVAGYDALAVFDTAWLGTADLSIQGPFRDVRGPLVGTARLLQRRRSGGVFEVTVGAEDGDPTLVAVATVTHNLLSRQDNGKVSTAVAEHAATLATVPLLASLDELVDPVPIEGGLSLDIDDHVRNSWHVLNGGSALLLAEMEAERAAAAVLGGPCAIAGMTVHYLAPGRVGPVEARATVLSPAHGDKDGAVGCSDNTATVRVRLTDAGAENRPVAMALVTARRDLASSLSRPASQ